MREVDLRGIDLNLLVALDALLKERNVTRAANRLGLSQPAASRALARLRALFSDALLVETRTGYVLSARAEEIGPALRMTLASIGDMLEMRAFDPAAATGQVRLMMLDLEAAVIGPHFLDRLEVEAPALDLVILPPGPSPFEALASDAADAIVGVVEEAPAGIRRRALYDDGFVTLMRSGHPGADHALTLERYLDLGHIVVSITGSGPAPIDLALAQMGRRRRVKVRVPNFLAAVEIAARSDLVMTLPSSLAQTAAGMGRFCVQPPPLALERFTMSLLWHARRQDDPRHIWLRRAIVAASTAITAARTAQRCG